MSFVLIVLRVIFVCLLVFIGFDIAEVFQISPVGTQYTGPILGFSIGIIIIVAETHFKPLFRKTTFAIITGLVIGLTSSYLLTVIIEATFLKQQPTTKLFETFKLLLTFVLSYLSISVVLQTKDKFKFIIPYFEFRGQKMGGKFILLDVSVLMDSRIIEFIKTNLFDGQIGLPKLAFQEFRQMSESEDPQKKIRGIAGLQNYLEIKSLKNINIEEIEDDHLPGDINLQIIRLGEMYQAKILTADLAIVSEAKGHNLDVININEIAKSFHPPFLPGEKIEVTILKAGDNKKQGVGYLEDATMVIVEDAKDHIGQTVTAEITQYLQKSNGNMYFANFQKVNTSDK